jgi:hypothetical protein
MATMFDNLLSPIVRGLSQSGLLQGSNRQVAEESFSLPAPSSGGGFAANYTPIRFAPLVSLTGPVMAPATPAAPEAAAPMLRLPMMADQGGGYETPQRTDAAFQNLQPIGERLATPEGRAAEFQNLSRAMTALMSPMTTIPSLALTGKTPMELMAQAMGMGGGQAAQGTPAAPFGGFLQGLQNLRDSFARNVFGPEEVPLFETRAPIESSGNSTTIARWTWSVYSYARSCAKLIKQTLCSWCSCWSNAAVKHGISLPEALNQSNSWQGRHLRRHPLGLCVKRLAWICFGPQNESSSYGGYFGGGNVLETTGAPGESQLRPFRFPLTQRQPASLQWPRWSINEH